MKSGADRKIDRVITRNLSRLSKFGVLTAGPGCEITGHQLTGRRAIVATVHTKKPAIMYHGQVVLAGLATAVGLISFAAFWTPSSAQAVAKEAGSASAAVAPGLKCTGAPLRAAFRVSLGNEGWNVVVGDNAELSRVRN